MTQKPKDGWGTYEYSWGATYEGEWRGGRMHGEGTYTFTNGDVYEGEFHDFHIHGKGIFTTSAWSFSGTLEQGRPLSGLLQEFGQTARGFAVKYDKGCAHIWDNPQPIEKVSTCRWQRQLSQCHTLQPALNPKPRTLNPRHSIAPQDPSCYSSQPV